MRRREFITLIGGAAAAWPVSAFAGDQNKPALIGYLTPGSIRPPFMQGLRDLGLLEGRDFQITYRSSGGYQDRLPALAEELVRLNPDILVAAGLAEVVALSKVTHTIPIVSATLADAVHLGLIASEARPGGNITGIEPYVAGLPAKQMELAREIVPGASKVGLLTIFQIRKRRRRRRNSRWRRGATKSTSRLRMPIDQSRSRAHCRCWRFVLQSSMLFTNSQQIAALAGVDLEWCWRRAASFVDKILQGARPGDLPVEFSTKMLLAINPKTAKALGLTVPSALLIRADEVIE